MQFTLAVDRGYKDGSGEKLTDFISCVAWKGTAENLAKYQTKGSLVLVDGQIQTRTYDDKNGSKHYITEVLANRIEFLSPKKEDNNQQYSQPNYYNNTTYTSSFAQSTHDPISQFNQYQQMQQNQDFFKQQEQSNNPFGTSSNNFGITNDDLPF